MFDLYCKQDAKVKIEYETMKNYVRILNHDFISFDIYYLLPTTIETDIEKSCPF